MGNALENICAEKRRHIADCKARMPINELVAKAAHATPSRGFAAALFGAATNGYGLIAEIKRASPSKGLIRNNFDPTALAHAYKAGGATCISVLTDQPYFQGEDEHLKAARAAVDLPILRKDFILDPYQVIETRALGADCILLILAALDDDAARELEILAIDHNMDVLIEVHDETELERALKLKSCLIGVNNRNLKSLQTDINTTILLANKIPSDRLLICESGLGSKNDLAKMANVGARCFLIGEYLMRQPDVEVAVREILANPIPNKKLALERYL